MERYIHPCPVVRSVNYKCKLQGRGCVFYHFSSLSGMFLLKYIYFRLLSLVAVHRFLVAEIRGYSPLQHASFWF